MSEKMNTVNLNASITEQDLTKALEVVENLRGGWHKQLAEDGKSMQELRAQNRESLYGILAKFYEFAKDYICDEKHELLHALLGKHGIRPASDGQNPFRPLADIMFGKWVEWPVNKKSGKEIEPKGKLKTATVRTGSDGRRSYFVLSSSSLKYAKVARYAYDNDWSLSDFVEKLSEFSGGMTGVVAADTVRHSRSDSDLIEIENKVKELKSQTPIVEIDIKESGLVIDKQTNEHYVGLWAEVDGDKLLVKGTISISEQVINGNLKKEATKSVMKR